MPFLNVKRAVIADLRILVLGDSRSDVGVRPTLWPNQLTPHSNTTVVDFATSGWGLSDLAGLMPTTIPSYIAAHPGAVFYALIGPMGANDLGYAYGGTGTAAGAAAAYSTYLADNIIEPLRALGVAKIGLFTEMHTANAEHNACRDQLNAIYRTGSVGGNPVTIVDVAADPVMAPDQEHYTNPALYGNTEWWVDTTHQGAKGDAIYAGYADAALAAMGALLSPTVFGMKQSATTGSISSGSNLLTVASASGFSVGDPIIVETGNEAGLGMFGTVGVGGAWPDLVFPTDAAVLAQTTSYGGVGADGQGADFARAADSGKVYKANNTHTGYYPWEPTGYYFNKAQPHALVTTITNIAGNVLTLATTASATTTNANVYFNCYPILNALSNSQENILPAGTYRYSGAIQYASDKRPGFVLKGQPGYATKLIVPKGCTCVGFQFFQCDNFQLENLDIVLNFGDSGSGYCLYTTNGRNFHNYGWGVQVVATTTSAANIQNIVRNVKVTNVMKESHHGSACARLLFDNCHAIRTVKQQLYAGWHLQASDSGLAPGEIHPSVEFRDCSFTSPWMAWGAETFGSSGVRFTRLNLHNGLMAFNSASATELIDPVFYVTNNAIATDVVGVISRFSPLLDLNSNISNQSGIAAAGSGALIENPTITFEGTVQPDTYMAAISVTASGDVWIKGTYDPTTPNDGNRKGLITGPWMPPGSTSPTAGPILNISGPRVKVTGIRVTTDANQGPAFSVAVGVGYTTTSSTINALSTSGTGSIAVASTQWFGGAGKLLIDAERMSYTSVDGTHLNITARGIDGTTAVTHANGSTVTYLDTPIVQGNVVDNIYMPALLATNTGNVTGAVYDALGAPSIPAGADALWYADQANTTAVRQHIPNEITKAVVAVPTWVNASPKPRTDYSLVSVTQTTGLADSYGGHNGLRLVGTGSSWLVRDDVLLPFKAATYTLIVIGKSNSGGAQTAKLNFNFSGGSGTTVTFNTTLTRVSHTAAQGAFDANPFNLSSSGAGADITIERWFVYEGATDPFPGNVNGEAYGGHLLFGGISAYTARPAVAANEVDINSATALGQILFDSFRSLSSFTAFATVRKVAVTPNGANTIYSGMIPNNFYGDIGLFADMSNGIGFYFRGPFQRLCYNQPFDPGVNTLFELLNKGYNVLVWRYDAATSSGSFWVNDVLMSGEVAAAPALADFQGLFFNYPNPRASVKWNSGAFYPSALSRANIEAVVSTLRAKATANSLTLDPMSRFVFFEGDSNTAGGADPAPGGQAWMHLYAANAAQPFYGAPIAVGGAKLADMVSRAAAFVNPAVPTVKAGRKFILAGMVGTNDASTNYTSTAATYSTNLLAYWAAAKAAGWTTIGMPILPRTDINVAASPPFDTWRGTINSNLVAAVGTQLDACLNPSSIPLLFANGASDNTTYFYPDKVHLKPAGQALLEAAMRPIINSFL